MEETDRILQCEYCRNRLYISPLGHLKYFLAPKQSAPDLFFLPYWRFKGIVFSNATPELEGRIVDSNLLALKLSNVPVSLGVRPQVLKLRYAGPGLKGTFLHPRLPCRTLAAGYGGHASGTFIGETVSLIYSPVSVRGNLLFDAILERPICRLNEPLSELPPPFPRGSLQSPPLPNGAEETGGDFEREDWVKFVATLCPDCGWDLDGEKDTLVLLCRKCGSGWQAGGAGLERIELGVKHPPDRRTPVVYLPFWRFTGRVTGLELKSYADLVRIANLPRVIPSAWEEREPHLWVPAFKIQPHMFLRLAKALTVLDREPEPDPQAEFPTSPLFPVTLALNEAEAGLEVLIASLLPSHKPVLSTMDKLSFSVTGSSLLYLPFVSRGEELILAEIPISIQKNAVSLGRLI
jgi:hypothetical protein